MKRLRQLFTYSGSKFTLSTVFATYYAKHRRFVSLFGGSAGEFAGKPPSPIEIYNDLDDHLHLVWQVLQNQQQYEQLLRLLENTPNGRRQYEICHRILHDPPKEHPPVRRAWAFLACGNICHLGFHPAIKKAWGTYCDAADAQTRNIITLPQRLWEWRERFRRVRIEHSDWRWVFKKYDRHDTQFFLDPPYFPSTLHPRDTLYRHELSMQMHVELLRAITTAQGYIMLCGYNHPVYTSYLFHWRKVEFAAKASLDDKRSPRREVIWMNYESDATRVGTNKLLIAKRYVEILGGGECAQRYLDRIIRLLSIPRPVGTLDSTNGRRQAWLNYADDGRRLPSTKMLVARRYVEMLGGPAARPTILEVASGLCWICQSEAVIHTPPGPPAEAEP